MELEKVLVIDPVTNVEETYKTKEVVYKSNVNTSLYRYDADSQSTTNIIFNNITPPSLNTIINRCLKLKYTLYVAVTGTGGAVPTFKPNAVATGAGNLLSYGPNGIFLADSPLQTCCTAIELRINGSSTSISPNDYIQLYSHMASKDDLNMFSTTYPHQKDNMPIYLIPATDVNNFRAPYQSFNVNTDLQSRASSVWTYVNSVAGVDNYTVSVIEDLYLSPMVWGEMCNKVAGLSNVNNLTLNIRIADLNRAVRCIANNDYTHVPVAQIAVPITAISVNFGPTGGRNAELELQYITPDPVLSAKMPSVLAMDYDYIQSFISNQSAQTLTASTEVTLQSVRLPSIPKRIYVYAKPKKSLVQNAPYINTVPDFFLPITNLKVTFNNRINLLANDIPQTLYNKSVANGLKDSFYEWQYGCGSIMIIDVAKDLGLEADECVGQANKYSTLQIQATFSNSNLVAQGVVAGPVGSNLLDVAGYDFYILVESPGKAFVTSSDCQFVLTGPSSAEVLALTSSMDKVADQSDLDGKQVGGGAFGLGKLFKSGLKLAQNINPEHVAQGIKTAQGVLGSLGMGVAGGAMKHKRVY
jgi:hypothetical protein